MQTRLRFQCNNDDTLWALHPFAELIGRSFVMYSEEDTVKQKAATHPQFIKLSRDYLERMHALMPNLCFKQVLAVLASEFQCNWNLTPEQKSNWQETMLKRMRNFEHAAGQSKKTAPWYNNLPWVSRSCAEAAAATSNGGAWQYGCRKDLLLAYTSKQGQRHELSFSPDPEELKLLNPQSSFQATFGDNSKVTITDFTVGQLLTLLQ